MQTKIILGISAAVVICTAAQAQARRGTPKPPAHMGKVMGMAKKLHATPGQTRAMLRVARHGSAESSNWIEAKGKRGTRVLRIQPKRDRWNLPQPSLVFSMPSGHTIFGAALKGRRSLMLHLNDMGEGTFVIRNEKGKKQYRGTNEKLYDLAIKAEEHPKSKAGHTFRKMLEMSGGQYLNMYHNAF